MKTTDIARICHEANRGYCMAIGDDSQHSWDSAPDWQRESVISGVSYVMEHPKVTPEEIHGNWLKEKAEQGWKYGPRKDEHEKVHPCFLPWSQLHEEDKVKDTLFCIITKTFLNDF